MKLPFHPHTRSLGHPLILLVSVGALLLLVGTSAWGAGKSRRILVLHAHPGERPAVAAVNRALMTGLWDRSDDQLQIYSEFLDLAPLESVSLQRDHVGRQLREYARMPPDLIISGGSAPLRALQSLGESAFPGVPILFCAVESRELRRGLPSPRVTGVRMQFDFRATLEAALRLQPDARRVAVVAGSGDFDQFFERQARTILREYERRLNFLYLTDLPMATLRRELAALPPRTIVLYLSVSRDGDGETFTPRDVLAQLAPISSAPIYSISDTFLGHGIVGGSLSSFELQGKLAAELALRVLGGEKPGSIPIVDGPNTLLFDWRQLRKWHLSEDRLPPGSIVRYRVPPIWKRHQAELLTGGPIGLIALSLASVLWRERRMREQWQQDRAALMSRQLSKALGDALLASPSIPVAVLDRDGIVLAVNQAWRQFVAEKEAPLIVGVEPGSNFLEASRRAAAGASSDLQAVPDELQAVLEGRRGPLVTAWASPLGEPRYELRAEPLPWGAGVVVWHRDTTNRRQEEAQAFARYREEGLVAHTLLLGEMAAALAHELKQPLAAVLSNSQAAQRFLTNENPDLAEVREILADISADDKHAVEILNRIRGMMRGSEPEFVPLNLNELIRKVVGAVTEDARGHEVRIELELDPLQPWVNGDAVQLHQALSNLIRNAIQAMETTPPEERRLTIRTCRTDAQTVEVTVRDRGAGIPEERLKQIFKPFYSTKPTGMGIGLAVTQSILELHRGRLWATNNPDRGATLHFGLPVLNESP